MRIPALSTGGRLWLGGALALAIPAVVALAGSVNQGNLVSDGAVNAKVIDPNLKNPWGVSESPTGPFWVSDNATGVSTLYDSDGTPFPTATPLVVTIPPPLGASGPSAPTGQAFNGSTDFVLTNAAGASAPAVFLFATEDGTIAGWNPTLDPTHAITAVDNSAGGSGAVYKGLARVSNDTGNFLLAANFRSGLVEVYDGGFQLVTSFRDTTLPASYAPFNVAALGGHIFVTYAKQLPGGHDDEAGRGHGFVDEVDIAGTLIQRIHSKGVLNSPWGMTIAPASFGRYAGALLVGNFGDGRIHAFDIAAPSLLGALRSGSHNPLAIPGLWALITGNGGLGGLDFRVYFTAGPNEEQNGLFGRLVYQPNASELP